jgi:hypothetical protein
VLETSINTPNPREDNELPYWTSIRRRREITAYTQMWWPLTFEMQPYLSLSDLAHKNPFKKSTLLYLYLSVCVLIFRGKHADLFLPTFHHSSHRNEFLRARRMDRNPRLKVFFRRNHLHR